MNNERLIVKNIGLDINFNFYKNVFELKEYLYI